MSRLRELGHSISGLVSFGTLAFGFLFEDQLVVFSNQPWFKWIATIGLACLAISGVYFLFWANRYYNRFLDAVSIFWNWLWNIPIAGLGRAFVNLVVALLPFYQHPVIFAPIALYFALILDVWFMKWVFRRALALARFNGHPKRVPSFHTLVRPWMRRT